MDELVEWLRAQLDDDAGSAGKWHDLECSIHAHQEGGLLKAVAALEVYAEVPGAVCDCGGPARVLREVDAKRRIIGRINSHAAVMGRDEVHGDLLRSLALPYADRPGYREEWRP